MHRGRQIRFASLALFSILLSIGCDSAEQSRTAPHITNTPSLAVGAAATSDKQKMLAEGVRVAADPVQLSSGASTEAVVRLIIAPPLHINANPATHSYLIPTQLSASAPQGAGVTIGAPVYPRAITRKFAFDEAPLSVYEGTIEIRLPLSAERSASSSERVFPLRVRVQPCDEEVCYPPRTIDATLMVNISG